MTKKLVQSLHFAFAGIKHAIRTERNMKIHMLCALAVSLFGMTVPLEFGTRVALLFAMAMVLFAELLNTALEAIVDLYMGETHRLAMVAKDAAAGGVLIIAVASVFVFAEVVWLHWSYIASNVSEIAYWGAFGVSLIICQALALFLARWRFTYWLAFAASVFIYVPLFFFTRDVVFSVVAFILILLSLVVREPKHV